MGTSFTPELIRLLTASGCHFERHGEALARDKAQRAVVEKSQPACADGFQAFSAQKCPAPAWRQASGRQRTA